jgi:CheY-like chemotaxis protein/anti-sigma regulatory factor (Ser/Thr protein kinase)
MWNLLSNAVKFTPNGGMVQVLLSRDDDDVVIRVIDSGIGIAPEFMPYVFDRFRQQDASITRKHGGLGLGLSIARQLVELHGGTIAVSSHGSHAGTTFTVRLPVAEAEAQAPQPEPVITGTPARQGGLAGVKVLLVDDSHDTLDVLQQILQNSGATIMAASSAGTALALLEREQPDVIVSDIGMPDIDGFELMRRIRHRAASAGGAIPAIALTAFTRQDDRHKAMQAGFNDYLSKPVEPGSLVAHIAQAVGVGTDQ